MYDNQIMIESLAKRKRPTHFNPQGEHYMSSKPHVERLNTSPLSLPSDLNCGIWEKPEPSNPIELQYLQNRVATLETRLQQAITNSSKKDDYVNKLTMDLEHIIMQLQRLELINKGKS